MTQNVVIVGAVALGSKVACRLRRIIPDASVTMVDRDRRISYGGCGIPYYVGGDVPELEGLYSTSAHVIRDTDFFKNAKGVEVLTETEAVSIDRNARQVSVRNLRDGSERDLSYHHLVLATGARPVVPPIPGVDLPGVTVVANLADAETIKAKITSGQVGRAVIIGGGAIGLEMAEALSDLWGVDTALVEMQDQLLPASLGPDLATIVKENMAEKGVRVLLGRRVTGISNSAEETGLIVETTGGSLPCDLVVLAVGARPNTRIARQAGLAVGLTGGIVVDSRMRTSDPHIYAGGDCVELKDLVSGNPVHMPLGSLANRQGRVIANNIAGLSSTFHGTVGTFCIKVFDVAVARAGLTVEQAGNAGFDPVYSVIAQPDRAHFYPSQQMMFMKLVADRGTRRVLGVEAIGPQPDAVKSRVDAVAACLAHRPDLDDIANLEVAYSPPFAAAMDIVNTVANVLDNTLAGLHDPVDASVFLEDFASNGARVLDVRSRRQAAPFVTRYGDRWQNIPQEELNGRLDELEADGTPYYILCGVGSRAYEAQLLLRKNGIGATRNIQGGMKMILSQESDFAAPNLRKESTSTAAAGSDAGAVHSYA